MDYISKPFTFSTSTDNLVESTLWDRIPLKALALGGMSLLINRAVQRKVTTIIDETMVTLSQFKKRKNELMKEEDKKYTECKKKEKRMISEKKKYTHENYADWMNTELKTLSQSTEKHEERLVVFKKEQNAKFKRKQEELQLKNLKEIIRFVHFVPEDKLRKNEIEENKLLAEFRRLEGRLLGDFEEIEMNEMEGQQMVLVWNANQEETLATVRAENINRLEALCKHIQELFTNLKDDAKAELAIKTKTVLDEWKKEQEQLSEKSERMLAEVSMKQKKMLAE